MTEYCREYSIHYLGYEMAKYAGGSEWRAMMKKKLIMGLCLVLFPSIAFGQTDSECRDRQKLTEMAIEVRDRVSEGESEDSLLMWAGNVAAPGLQAAAYKAIEAFTFSPPSKSVPRVVTIMSFLCSKAYSP